METIKAKALVKNSIYRIDVDKLFAQVGFLTLNSLNDSYSRTAYRKNYGSVVKVVRITSEDSFGLKQHYVQVKNLDVMISQNYYIPISMDVSIERLTEIPFTMKALSAQASVWKTGWDPEMFVVDEKNSLIPAFGFLPSKQTPIIYDSGVKVSDTADRRYNAIYYDGFQAEFSTFPIQCHGYGIDYLRSGLRGILLEARKKSPKAQLSLKSVFRISPQMMMESDDEFVALGCNPSENVYGGPPLIVDDARNFPYRVAGGHVHFEIPSVTIKEKLPYIIRAMDFFLALPCVGMFADVDDPLRREFYGKAGEHRIPKYGLEYRTLSNAWLCSPIITHGVMDLARRAVAAGQIEGFDFKQFGTSDEEVQEIINFCDVKNARKIIEKHWPVWDSLLKAAGYNPKMVQAMSDGFLGSVGAIVPEYEKIESNWRLDIPMWQRHSDNSGQTWAKRFS